MLMIYVKQTKHEFHESSDAQKVLPNYCSKQLTTDANCSAMSCAHAFTLIHEVLHCNWHAGRYRGYQSHWYCKYWWGAALTEAGFTVMFLDNDAIVLGDPYQGMQPEK